MKQITCRVQKPVPPEDNPWKLQYMEMQENEAGKRKLVPADCVKPSLADDFSVQNNAIYRGMAHGYSERINCDVLDFEEKIEKVM